MSSRTDLLDHPDLSKVWVTLESAAPTLDVEDMVTVGPEASSRRFRRPTRRTIAVGAAFLMVLFIGTETLGVVSAQRALAAGEVVADRTVEVDMVLKQLPEPWADLQAPLGLRDLELRPDGIVAIASEADGDPPSWLLDENGWTRIADVEYPIDWGATVENGLIAESATDGKTTVFVGVTEESLLSPDGNPTIWTSTDHRKIEPADLPSLRSLGFGYLIGGFRLDGIEHVIHTESGFVAYTGYLQVWDGFENFTLEPRQAWASLVLLSPDGQQWTPHVLSDFAIAQIVPFGDGMLAAAGLPPERETVTTEVDGIATELAESDRATVKVDGVATEVAVDVQNKLFYSEDGVRWEAIADSPAFGKPLLAATSEGNVIVVDEYRVEKADTPSTQTFVIEAPADTTG